MNGTGIVNVFEAGGDVWESFQRNVKNALGSSAVINPPVTYRPDYAKVSAVLSGQRPICDIKSCPNQ
jgi:hypothetical protein